jgi:hypothetical protein
MTLNTHPAAFGLRMSATERAMGRFMRNPEGHTDDGDGRREVEEQTQEEKDAAAAAAAAAAAGTGNADTPTAEEIAELRRQAKEAQDALKKFEGLDPEAARKAIADAATAEAARIEAEKAKAKAEGNFEKLRELQAQEAQAAIDAANAARDTAVRERDEARRELSQSRIETAFANSKFLQDETILSGPRAQRLFADHVEIENGKVVVYDKAAGETKRAKIMDTKGNPLPFNDAIAKLINAQPDKDTLLKAKTTPGAGSKTTEGKTTKAAEGRQARLAAGLKALREKK